MSAFLRIASRPIYARNLDVAEAASLVGPMRRGIAISCWAYGIGILLLNLSPAGPATRWAMGVMISVGTISLVLGVLWWTRGWPRAYVSLAFLLYSELAHTGILLLTESSMLALIATLWFALMGEHITIAHGRRAVIAHCLWALLNIVYFATMATQRTNANAALVIYVSCALVGLIVAIPIFRQYSADALRDDSRRAAAMAERDSLTELLNHRGMYAAVPGLIAAGRPDDGTLAIVVMDLDRFKSINDRFGHYQGDQVLVQVASRLGAAVRRGAVVARTGGEEFVVIDTVGPDGGGALAHRLLAAVHLPDQEMAVTASVGVATCPLDHLPVEGLNDGIQKLTRLADMAMYSAKRDGGNQVRVVDTEAARAS